MNQDRLIRLIDNLFHNRDVTSLTRKFVRAGVMIDGRLVRTERGIPQGGPLSPVLANIYLDQVDKELESRGLRFTRYADDMLIYVKSEAAANRVMKSFSNYLEKKLKLEVNASKSKVARPDEVKYLGFGFKRNKREWKAIPHEKSIHEFEQKMMKLTKRNWSVSLEERIEKINQVIRGWSNYFRCAWLYKETVRKLDSKAPEKNQGHYLEAVEKHQEKRREPCQAGMSQRQGSLICVCTTRMRPLCSHVPEQVYQKYTPEEERSPDHRGILRYGGRKVHEYICMNRPVPKGTLGGVRGSVAVVHGYACVVCAVCGCGAVPLHEGRAHDLIYNTMFV